MSIEYYTTTAIIRRAETLRKETWWKEKDISGQQNMRFVPMNLKTDGKILHCLLHGRMAEAHGHTRDFQTFFWNGQKSAQIRSVLR
jgi:hypothetical protein